MEGATFNHCLIPELVLNQYVYNTVQQPQDTAKPSSCPNEGQVEDVQPIDMSFFCTHQFTEDIIEKNIRQAIEEAKSKADACRRIMALEKCGYIRLSNVKDERKAELLNPFAMPKYSFTAEDFRKARNSRKVSESFRGN